MIRVGLGSGRKEQRLAEPHDAASDPARVHGWRAADRHAGEHLQVDCWRVKDANLGSPADFVTDPSTIPPQPPQPDPERRRFRPTR
jgi:hypothetical protein